MTPQPDLWKTIRYLHSACPQDAGSGAVGQARRFAHVLGNIPLGLPDGECLAGDFGFQWGRDDHLAQAVACWQPPPGSTHTPPGLEELSDRFSWGAGYAPAHTAVHYPVVLREGLDGIRSRIASRTARAPADQRTCLQAMDITLQAVIDWSARYVRLARDQADRSGDPADPRHLRRIAKTCTRVPRLPARNVHEALQAIWLIHAAVGISELSGASLSLGRMDQYLLVLYRSDLAAGVAPKDLDKSLGDFLAKMNRFGDPAQTVNLGGLSGTGSDELNEVSRWIVRIAKSLAKPAPLLAARLHPGVSQEDFNVLADPDLMRMGQPTWYGEHACRHALARRGVAGGDCETFEQFFETFVSWMEPLVALLIAENRRITRRVALGHPNPFVSALLSDCIERGRGRLGGGARYETVTVEAFGLINAADALATVRELVYRRRRYRLEDLIAAARADFRGYEEIHAAIEALPKFGQDDPETNAMAARVAQAFARIVTAHSGDGVTFMPSFHTLNAHIRAGARLGASLDGRRAGQPLAKNIGPVLGRRTGGHTALMLSAAAIDQSAFFGGQALDISFELAQLASASGREAFRALLQSYFDLGGLQVQVNGLDASALREAMESPADHQDLIVRVAGYSAQFVGLDRDTQAEMVQRRSGGL